MRWIAIAITVSMKAILFLYGGLITLRRLARRSKLNLYPYADVYEYETLTQEQYERRKNKNVWKGEWVVFNKTITDVTVRRVRT